MKKLIYLLLLCFTANYVLSQETNKDFDTTFIKNYIEEPDNIYEATVSTENPILILQENGKFYYKYNIIIHRIFKGKGKLGESTIFNFADNYKTIDANGDSITNYSFDVNSISIIPGETYLFGTKKMYKSEILENNLDNNDLAIYGFWYFIHYDSFGIRGNNKYSFKFKGISGFDSSEVLTTSGYKSFLKVSDLYKFLLSHPNIYLHKSDETVFERINPKVETIKNIEQKPIDYDLQKKNFERRMFESYPYKKGKGKKNKKQNINKNALLENLQFKIKNAKYSTPCSNNSFLDFDIVIKPNSTKYFAKGVVFLNFNPSVFGPDPFATNDLVITKGSFFNSPTYTLITYLGPPNEYVIQVGDEVGTLTKSQIISNNDYVLFHIQIKVSSNNNNDLTNLSFDLSYMNTSQSYYTDFSTSNIWTEYNSIISSIPNESAINHKPFRPEVISISSQSGTFKGGTKEEVIINGRFFGNNKGQGSVGFLDANVVSSQFYYLEPDDYV